MALGPTQFFQLLYVQLDGACKRGVCSVGQPEFFSRFFYDGGQRWIVHVADLRKEMVFNLVIQTTAVPCEEF